MSKITEKIYEIGIHISPNTPKPEYTKISTNVIDFMNKSNVSVVSQVPVEEMDLAYEVRDKNRAQDGTYNRFNTSYFTSIKFKSATDFVSKLKEYISEEKNIFRSLIWVSMEGDTRYEVPKEDLPKETNIEKETKIKKEAQQENEEGMVDDMEKEKKPEVEAPIEK